MARSNPPPASPEPAALAAALRLEAQRLGFDPVGIAAVPGGANLALRTAALERWLQAGHQGGMAWMADPRRRSVETLLPGVRSLLAVGLPYYVATQRRPHCFPTVWVPQANLSGLIC